MMEKVLCVGETMAMVSPAASEALVSSELFTIAAGGAESNVAGHLAAMGFATSWLGRVGDDALGDRILAEMQSRHVNTEWVVRDATAPTGVYFKDPVSTRSRTVQYYRANSAASRMSVDDFSFWPFASATWVHTSGITPALSTSCDELVERIIDMASAQDYVVSFDVNYRSVLWAADDAAARCSFLGNQCHLVLVGLDEAETLWGAKTAEDVASIFPLAPLIVVKDGGVEAVELALQADGTRKVTRVPALSVAVVEAIGAGDAFAAGYIGGLLRGVHSLERLAAGHELAAWTLGSLADFRPRDNQPETRS